MLPDGVRLGVPGGYIPSGYASPVGVGHSMLGCTHMELCDLDLFLLHRPQTEPPLNSAPIFASVPTHTSSLTHARPDGSPPAGAVPANGARRVRWPVSRSLPPQKKSLDCFVVSQYLRVL